MRICSINLLTLVISSVKGNYCETYFTLHNLTYFTLHDISSLQLIEPHSLVAITHQYENRIYQQKQQQMDPQGVDLSTRWVRRLDFADSRRSKHDVRANHVRSRPGQIPFQIRDERDVRS
jgi:hypothetical protein